MESKPNRSSLNEAQQRIEASPANTGEVSQRNIAAGVLLLLSMIASCYFVYGYGSTSISGFFSEISGDVYYMLLFALPLPLAILLNFKWPADNSQKLFTPSFALDLVYHVFRFALNISLIAVLVVGTKYIYDTYLGFLTITVSADIPVWIRVVGVLLISDFLGWAHHYVRHWFKPLWHFHAVHHSQRELNYFTDSRVHLFDRVWSWMLIFIPSYMLQIPIPPLILLLGAMSFQRYLYHSNLKSNFGFLRYILVTPQSHRVHHSTRTEHLNTNFGVNFSIWDHLFGTQYVNYDEYPSTGIDDKAFPFENRGGFVQLIDTFGAQFLYPFRQIYADAKSAYASFLLRRAGIEREQN